MWLALVVEYVAGSGFGLLVLQALFMKDMMALINDGDDAFTVLATLVLEPRRRRVSLRSPAA
jgi:hypothetical protein